MELNKDDIFYYIDGDMNRVPEGYKPIQAYAKGDKIVVPVSLPNDKHDCDCEGCGTLDHVERFSISEKYKHIER